MQRLQNWKRPSRLKSLYIFSGKIRLWYKFDIEGNTQTTAIFQLSDTPSVVWLVVRFKIDLSNGDYFLNVAQFLSIFLRSESNKRSLETIFGQYGEYRSNSKLKSCSLPLQMGPFSAIWFLKCSNNFDEDCSMSIRNIVVVISKTACCIFTRFRFDHRGQCTRLTFDLSPEGNDEDKRQKLEFSTIKRHQTRFSADCELTWKFKSNYITYWLHPSVSLS